MGVFLIKKCYHLEVDRECDLDLVTMILILIFCKSEGIVEKIKNRLLLENALGKINKCYRDPDL